MTPKLLAVFALLLFCMVAACDRGIVRPKAKLVFIYCDVTKSLIKNESAQVSAKAAEIIENLPAGSRYELVPIHLNTERSEAIKEGYFKPGIEIPKSVKIGLRTNINTKIETLFQQINDNDPKNPNRQIPERTCIISGLSRAAQFFNKYKSVDYENELILISDMCEHCFTASNENKTAVRLETQTPEQSFNLVKDFQFPDLSDIRITIIMPTAFQNDKTSLRPHVTKLNAFWSKVFEKCHNRITEGDWFTDTVPPRVYQIISAELE